MKSGIKLVLLLKTDLIVNVYKMRNIQKLKKNLMMEKSIKILIMIELQKKVLNTLVYQ